MASGRFAWGIDVGNRALKAVKLVREGDRLRVVDFEVIEYESVLSNAGDNRDSLIQGAVANFVQKHNIRGGIASVGVSGQSSFARFIKLPPVEPKKIPEIVRFEAIQQIPFPLDDVEWSYQLFKNADSPDVEVGIFAMRRELINQQMRFFTEADLNVQVVQMNPLAVYNAMYYDSQIEGTTMIIDMGAENTDLIIAEGENVWLRSIPIGGNNFTESLVKAFKLNFAKAEEMKRNASTSKYARQIFQAMRPIFADLVAEVQRSIGFYASTHKDSRIARVIASGGAFRLPGLQKYLQQNLQLDVQVLESFVAGAPSDGKLAAAFNENILSLAAAYGLAIQAMGEGKITSSLLPQHIRRAKLWKEKTKWFGIAAALFVVGTGIAYGRAYLEQIKGESSSAETAQQKINTIETTAQKYDRDWDSLSSAGAADRQAIANYQSLLDYRHIWPNLLISIRNSLPTPQPDVASGIKDRILKIPRGDRKQIVIDSIDAFYYSDLKSVLASPPPSGWTTFAPTPGTQAGSPPSPPQNVDTSTLGPSPMRGFILTIVCTTPNRRGYAFVSQTFIDALQKLGYSPDRNFAVARVQMVHTMKLGMLPNRLSAIGAAAQTIAAGQASPTNSPNPQIGPPPIESPVVGPSTPTNTYLDRLTGEDVTQDTEVQIALAVVLDPTPPPPTSPNANAPAQP
ncbi:MAG TPA: type IV pilus assembly protein PilM [Tepidisphaeraceae bacterium]|nr:type IV pilus assembly protein PilM [Tepidisphaeraceae bacterium]